MKSSPRLSLHLLVPLLLFGLLSLAESSLAEQNFFGNTQDTFSSFAAEEPVFLPVDEAYVLSSRVEGNDLVIRWDIAEGYYLYKKSMDIAADKTTTTFESPLWSKQGKEKQDEYFGLVRVFYDFVEVRVPAIKAPNSEAKFAITYQGCAEAGLCYPPQKRQALFVGSDEQSANPSASPANSTSASDGLSNSGQINKSAPANGAYDATSISEGALANQALEGVLRALPPSGMTGIGLWSALLFAFIGGLILNLMPCVFPVLSLKALALAKSSQRDNKSNQLQALAYTAGVVSLFCLIAIALITLRNGGEHIGWGFQLQSPWFVGLMVYLFFLVALSLVGWLQPGARLMGVGEELTASGGNRGSFFTGALAVVVASPCTAPFMGSALGYAITLPTIEAITVFIALGLGMAFPFLLLGFLPATAKLLPKPGPWMDTFKQLLAFPMFLSALWLLWVLGRQTSVEGMSLVLLGLIGLAFSIWLYKYAQSKTRSIRGLALSTGVVSVAISLWMLNNQALHNTASAQVAAGAQAYEIFDSERLDDWRKTGKTVFVNVTADWCVSCLVNEQTVLSLDPVASLLASSDIIYVKGDWTNDNPAITNYLASFGRNGVPLYVVYPPGQAPQVLSQILTTAEVINALKVGNARTNLTMN